MNISIDQRSHIVAVLIGPSQRGKVIMFNDHNWIVSGQNLLIYARHSIMSHNCCSLKWKNPQQGPRECAAIACFHAFRNVRAGLLLFPFSKQTTSTSMMRPTENVITRQRKIDRFPTDLRRSTLWTNRSIRSGLSETVDRRQWAKKRRLLSYRTANYWLCAGGEITTMLLGWAHWGHRRRQLLYVIFRDAIVRCYLAQGKYRAWTYYSPAPDLGESKCKHTTDRFRIGGFWLDWNWALCFIANP